MHRLHQSNSSNYTHTHTHPACASLLVNMDGRQTRQRSCVQAVGMMGERKENFMLSSNCVCMMGPALASCRLSLIRAGHSHRHWPKLLLDAVSMHLVGYSVKCKQVGCGRHMQVHSAVLGSRRQRSCFCHWKDPAKACKALLQHIAIRLSDSQATEKKRMSL